MAGQGVSRLSTRHDEAAFAKVFQVKDDPQSWTMMVGESAIGELPAIDGEIVTIGGDGKISPTV